MLSVIITLVAIVVLIIIDQLIKSAVVNNLPYHEPITAIKGLLNWTYTTNKGGAFSILSGKTVFLLIVTVIFMAVMFVLYFKYRSKLKHWTGLVSVPLILAGGIGNMIDRLFNDGSVVDYIDISPIFSFPIFNFADCCVTVGGVLIFIYLIFLHDKLNEQENASENSSAQQ